MIVAFRIVKIFFFIRKKVLVLIYLLRWTIVSHSNEKKRGSIKTIKGINSLLEHLGYWIVHYVNKNITTSQRIFFCYSGSQIYVKGLHRVRKHTCSVSVLPISEPCKSFFTLITTKQGAMLGLSLICTSLLSSVILTLKCPLCHVNIDLGD